MTGQVINFEGGFISNAAKEFGYCNTCGASSILTDTILQGDFYPVTEEVPNLDVSNKNHWFRFKFQNSSDELAQFQIPYTSIQFLDVYFLVDGQIVKKVETGTLRPFDNREINHQDFIISTPKISGVTEVYFRLKNNSQLLFPINISNQKSIQERILLKEHLLGIYGGIILVMLLYNLFIYTSTRDHNYLWYLLYLISVGITQLTLNGVLEKTIQIDSNFISTYSIHLAGIFSGLSVVGFAYFFLNVTKYAPWFQKALIGIGSAYFLTLVILALGFPILSYNLINATASIGVIVLLIGSINIARKGFRPAKFFIVAWSFFMGSIVIFVLKDVGVLPYNSYTVYAIPIGSAIEVILLSFALADKINVLTLEKEEAKTSELNALKENEILIKEQNVMLESKVDERTQELSSANKELEEVLYNLKNAQTQLVSQEKMASLGQLTAGIAHEINNPINFVSSNVNPLKRDIQDLKEVIEKYRSIASAEEFEQKQNEVIQFLKEIDYEYVIKEINQLVNGIEEGAARTAEIVKGLKNFSRLDELEAKTADLHQGIDSTLLILLSGSKVKVEVIKDYDTTIGDIECYPGKLNQVFSNILSNAFQAMEVNKQEKPATMIIKTKELTEHVEISFSDNGPGIPQKLIDKIFDPFFTTKEVGEGTGLGLSIVFSIIEAHKGNIEVNSNPPNGTEFKITLPKVIGE